MRFTHFWTFLILLTFTRASHSGWKPRRLQNRRILALDISE